MSGFARCRRAAESQNLMVGSTAIIAINACYFGLNVKGGTQGVGSATRTSVVMSSISILVGDYFLTKLFWIFEQWL